MYIDSLKSSEYKSIVTNDAFDKFVTNFKKYHNINIDFTKEEIDKVVETEGFKKARYKILQLLTPSICIDSNLLFEKFNQDDTSCFLIILKSGDFGLNLTGVDVVIHLDIWWNPQAENQATDRAHRIGQTKKYQI